MAQFDVHRNKGNLRDSVPYLVIVQSSQFDGHWRRVVVPLVKLSASGTPPFAALNPTFTIRGTRVVLHPLDVASVATEVLGPKVATLRDEGDRILGALDEMLSRAWR
jgi:toxin CcdB